MFDPRVAQDLTRPATRWAPLERKQRQSADCGGVLIRVLLAHGGEVTDDDFGVVTHLLTAQLAVDQVQGNTSKDVTDITRRKWRLSFVSVAGLNGPSQ